MQIDRRGTLAVVQAATVIGFVVATTAGMALGNQVDPALGAAAAVSGMGGIFALARTYWASSTTRVRRRISSVMDAVGRVIAQSESR